MPLEITITASGIADPEIYVDDTLSALDAALVLDTDPKHAADVARARSAIDQARLQVAASSLEDRTRFAQLVAANADLFQVGGAQLDEDDYDYHATRMISSYVNARRAIRLALVLGTVAIAPELAVIGAILAVSIAAKIVKDAYGDAIGAVFTEAFSIVPHVAAGPTFVDGEPMVLPVFGSFRPISDAERRSSDPTIAEVAEIIPGVPQLIEDCNNYVEPDFTIPNPVTGGAEQRGFRTGELAFRTPSGITITVSSGPDEPLAVMVAPIACPAEGEPQSTQFELEITATLPATPAPDPLVLAANVTCFHEHTSQAHVTAIDLTTIVGTNRLGQIVKTFKSNYPACFSAVSTDSVDLQIEFRETENELELFRDGALLSDRIAAAPSLQWTGATTLNVPLFDQVESVTFDVVGVPGGLSSAVVSGTVPSSFVFDVVEVLEYNCLATQDPAGLLQFDANQDLVTTLDEYRNSSVITALHQPDVGSSYSFAVALALVPTQF